MKDIEKLVNEILLNDSAKNEIILNKQDINTLLGYIKHINGENQRLNDVLNELEKIIQTDTKIYCCSESAMKSFKSAETIYRSYLLNKLRELKEGDK